MIKKTTPFFCVLLLISAALTFSCKTVPTSVPDGVTEETLLQLGQTALDSSNYKAAEFYYNKVIELYGSNIRSLVEAEYELAHIRIKRKNYKEARPALQRILSYYEDPHTAALLPASYKKLALTDLEKCTQGKDGKD